jgi:AcrR family transcriptional regulator
MDRVTPDQAGWESIHQWVVAYGKIYDLFRPVFVAFSTVVAEDTAVRIGAQHVFDRQAQDLLSKIDRRAFRARRPEVALALLLHTVPRTLRYRHLLGGSGDRIGAIGRLRVEQALSDVLHRALFGQITSVNVRAYAPHGSFAPSVAPRAAGHGSDGLTAAGLRTQAKLLEAGRKVITVRGYHEARVDDIVELADTSHGTFYRYFDNKEGLFRVLAAQSRLSLASAVNDLPAAMETATTPVGSAPLRQWVAHYLEVFGREGPVLKAWLEGLGVDPDLRSVARNEIESLWIRLAGFLAPFGVGDVDADALVMLSLLDRAEPTGVSGPIDPAVVGAFTRIFVQGFLLQHGGDPR